MKRSMLLNILGFALLAQVATAQVTVTNTCPVDAPVALQPGAVPAGTGQLVATVTNKGTKPITGVILHWTVTDSIGGSYVETSTIDYAPSGTLFEPSKSVQTDVDVTVAQGRTIKSVEVACLAILYQGKGVWGNATAREVARLRAVRQGIASERKRLLDIYNREGAARLADELNRPVVR
jgi:nitrous oxidase accessory protein NosD